MKGRSVNPFYNTVISITPGYEVGIILQFLLLFFFSLVLLSFVLSCPLTLFLSDQSMIYVLSVSLFVISFLCLRSFNQELLLHRNCCVCHVKLFIKSVSDRYSVDFLGKWRVFKLESFFKVSTLLYTSSLDLQVEFIIISAC